METKYLDRMYSLLTDELKLDYVDERTGEIPDGRLVLISKPVFIL